MLTSSEEPCDSLDSIKSAHQLQIGRREWYLWRQRALPPMAAIPTHGSPCLDSEPLPLGHPEHTVLSSSLSPLGRRALSPWPLELLQEREDVPADSTMLWPSQDPKRPLEETTNDQRQPTQGSRSVQALGLSLGLALESILDIHKGTLNSQVGLP